MLCPERRAKLEGKQTKRESHNEEVKDKEAGQLGNNDGEGLGQFS